MILHILCKQKKKKQKTVFTKYIDIYIDVKTPTCRHRYGTCECIHINIKYNKKKITQILIETEIPYIN